VNASSPAVRRCRPLLGTYVEIDIAAGALPAGTRPETVLAALEQAFAAMQVVQDRMSFHIATSDLSRLNRATPGTTLAIHRWTAEVLLLAQRLHAASEGRFDCGVGAVLRRRDLLPRDATGRKQVPKQRGSAMDIHVEVEANAASVQIRRAICLDLGGIAKGFAVDRAIDTLAAAGVASAVVNAGGDLRVLGARARPLHIRWPHAPATLVYLGELADGAAATSAAYFSPKHLIDPATDRPVASRQSFTVLAPLCAVADGLTKALAVDGALAESCLSIFGAQAVVL
jgi:thiamine biosynthesis lipoprotein